MRVNKAKQLWLIFAMATMLTAGCSQGAGQAPASSGDSGMIGTAEANKKLTIELMKWSPNKFDEPADNPIRKQIESDMNIEYKLTLVPGNRDAYIQSLTTRIASGDMPDLFSITPAEMQKYAEQGVLGSLDDLLSKFPDLKNSRTKEEWLYAQHNDKIYGIPRIIRGGQPVATYIRKDWLDKLKLSMPTTTNELFNVMKAFTFNDPDGNGKNDTYGYSANSVNDIPMSVFANAFGIPMMGSVQPGIPMDWIDAKGQLHFAPISAEFRNYLSYMNMLFNAKVVDPDLPSNTQQTFQQKMIQGQIGVVMMVNPNRWMFTGNKIVTDAKAVNPNANWVYLPPVKGPNGQFGNNVNFPISSEVLVVSQEAMKDPVKAERVVKLLDYMDRRPDGKKGGKTQAYGLPGIHHEEQNGVITKILPQLAKDSASYMGGFGLSGVLPDPEEDKLSYSKEDYDLLQQIRSGNKDNSIIANLFYGTLPFAYDGDKYVTEMALKFIYGKEDLADWNTYVKTLNDRYKYSQVQQIRTKELKDRGILK